jgi:hypothetical protein
VAVLPKEGAIRGIYVAATDGDGSAVANVVCDISPNKVEATQRGRCQNRNDCEYSASHQLDLLADGRFG